MQGSNIKSVQYTPFGRGLVSIGKLTGSNASVQESMPLSKMYLYSVAHIRDMGTEGPELTHRFEGHTAPIIGKYEGR